MGRRRGLGSRRVCRLGGVGGTAQGLGAGDAQLSRAGLAAVRAAAARARPRSRGPPRRDRAGGGGDRRSDAAERPGVDARPPGGRKRRSGRRWPASATSPTSTSCARSASARARSGNPALAEMARAGLAGRADLRPRKATCGRRSPSWSARSPALIALAARPRRRGGARSSARRRATSCDCRRRSACPFPIMPGPGAARRGAARTRAAGRGARGASPGAGPQRQPHPLGARFGPRRERARRGRSGAPSTTGESSPTTNKADADRPELAEVRRRCRPDAPPGSARRPLLADSRRVAAGVAGLRRRRLPWRSPIRRRRSGTHAPTRGRQDAARRIRRGNGSAGSAYNETGRPSGRPSGRPVIASSVASPEPLAPSPEPVRRCSGS